MMHEYDGYPRGPMASFNAHVEEYWAYRIALKENRVREFWPWMVEFVDEFGSEYPSLYPGHPQELDNRRQETNYWEPS